MASRLVPWNSSTRAPGKSCACTKEAPRSCSKRFFGLNLVMPFPGDFNRGAVARFLFALAVGLSLAGGFSASLRAADLEEARQQLVQGHYSDCIHLCEQALGAQEYSEEWRLLLIDCLMTVR